MTEKTVECILLINFILFCCNFAFTIGGSIILDQSNEASDVENKFFDIWIANLVLTSISGLNSLVAMFTCFGLTDINENKKTNPNQLLELFGSLVTIWLIVLYFDDSTNMDVLSSNFYSLYLLTSIRVIYSLVLLGLLGLVLFLACCTILFGGIYFFWCLPNDNLSDEIVRKQTSHV